MKAVGNKPNLYVADWQDELLRSEPVPGQRYLSLLAAQSLPEARKKFLAWSQAQGIKLTWVELSEIPFSDLGGDPVFVQKFRLL